MKERYWLTPPELYRILDDEFGFNYDPCPHPRPESYDGLLADWGEVSYVNPPFVGLTKWVDKAISENSKGKTVVMILPVDRWISRALKGGAVVRDIGLVDWISIETGEPKKSSSRPCCLFIWNKEVRP